MRPLILTTDQAELDAAESPMKFTDYDIASRSRASSFARASASRSYSSRWL
jgi:hypothetical protein